MIELFDKEEAIRIGLFVVSSVIGMLFAYYRKWSFEIPEGTGLFQYIFGDPHAIGRALTTLTAMCVGAGGLSYLDSLTASQILIAGASIGLLVPQTVAQKAGDSALISEYRDDPRVERPKYPDQEQPHHDELEFVVVPTPTNKKDKR